MSENTKHEIAPKATTENPGVLMVRVPGYRYRMAFVDWGANGYGYPPFVNDDGVPVHPDGTPIADAPIEDETARK